MKWLYCMSAMVAVAPMAWAGEAAMDIDPQGLLCVGDAPTTAYKQRCVAQCVVNGVDGFAYAGRMVDAGTGQGMELYTMNGEYSCPKGRLQRQDARQALAKDAAAVAHNLCGAGNLVRVVNGPALQNDGSTMHVSALVGCRDLISTR